MEKKVFSAPSDLADLVIAVSSEALHGPLPRRYRLPLSLDARFFVMLPFAQFRQDTSFFASLFESPDGAFN